MNKGIILLYFIFGSSVFMIAQDEETYDFTCEVNRVYKPLAISTTTLDTARTVDHLNPYFKPEWVREYASVEISTIQNGTKKTTITENEHLSEEQIQDMKAVDLGSEIAVIVNYIPENNLKHNDTQQEIFKFTVDPKIEATFPGGQQKLNEYISEHIKPKLTNADVDIYNVKTIQFSISEDGDVVDAHVPKHLFIYDTTRDTVIDDFLSQVICNMPKWNPAQYADGTKAQQDFVLTVGDHSSCTLNLLNIRRPLD